MIADRALVPPQAIRPLRERAAALRQEVLAATDPVRCAHLKSSLEQLDTLIHQLEHGHAPT